MFSRLDVAHGNQKLRKPLKRNMKVHAVLFAAGKLHLGIRSTYRSWVVGGCSCLTAALWLFVLSLEDATAA